MAATLGADVELRAPLGGESGHVLRALIKSEGSALRASCSQRASGVYIHDRRSGTRVEVATSLARPLRRHELDELYGITLTTLLCADAGLLTVPQPPEAIDARFYRRLTHDLRDNGKLVIADLCSSPPARLSTPSTGRSSASISLEYRVLTNAGLATSQWSPDPETRKFRVQVRDRAPGSDQLCAVSGALAVRERAAMPEPTAESRIRRIGPAPRGAGPSSEPDVPVSRHPAQASPVGW